MYLSSLQLSDFRNYHALDLHPAEGLNVLLGANGQGKSNILEAIYLLATSKSLRSHRDMELVRFRTELARVVGRVAREQRADVILEIDITPSQKFAKVNSVRQTHLVDFFGEFNAVHFNPFDVELVTGPPENRRGFLNLQIAQASGSYAYTLVYYKQVLQQRNRLLKDSARAGGMSTSNRHTLDALTEQLVLHGSQILDRRATFTRSLARFADELHEELTGSTSRLEVVYRPGWSSAAPEAPVNGETFRAALEAARPDELRRGITLAGPHRDDLQFLIGEMDARTYGSRGEQRTVALALKLAEFLLLREVVGEAPVMLLDDALSELDDERSMRVIRTSVGPCQSFMTGASLRSFPPEILEKATMFYLKSGELVEAAEV